MAYSNESFRRVKNRMEERRGRAMSEAEARRREVFARCPALEEIDAELKAVSMRLFRVACGGGDVAAGIEAVKRENLALQEKKGDLLASLGFSRDYTDVRFFCPVCEDNGYRADGAMCACMKKELAKEEIRLSGIGALVDTQSFENFRLEGNSEKMLRNLEICKEYAASFRPESAESLLFSGPTGLGKTHLSTAIAKTVIEKGYRVVYESMLNVADDFRFDRFHTAEGSAKSQKYFCAELLILDDVGAETPGEFNTSVLYQIVNTRQNQNLPTVISTNFSAQELMNRYDGRITSRLLGGYRVLLFEGRDRRIYG
jgi:DNA replication protein DnaC